MAKGSIVMRQNLYIKQASQLERQGKQDEAIAVYRKAIEFHPGFSWYYYRLGLLLASQGCYDGAFFYLSRACEINPNSACHNYMLSQVVSIEKGYCHIRAFIQVSNYPIKAGTKVDVGSLFEVLNVNRDNDITKLELHLAARQGEQAVLTIAEQIIPPSHTVTLAWEKIDTVKITVQIKLALTNFGFVLKIILDGLSGVQ